ncbi:hypothetical protein C8Q70DRAFT_1045966 [Cubamyces menziesii]|nr:hypothetical protein C8Q70DRAFT_1045966 [Cubamyces menziesii]
MEGLTELFSTVDIVFDHEGNRIRCFPHSVSRVVTAVLEKVKKEPIIPVVTLPSENIMGLQSYADALVTDPVKCTRGLVAACRKSGERRADLRRIITEGNTINLWGQQRKIPEKQLLRDCETRWSSTYQMIGRVLALYPAIQVFLNSEDHQDLAHLKLSSEQVRVLTDIHQVLQAPHAVQELLSSSRTPTLAMALPAFELLITTWESMKITIPEMAPFIDAGLERLDKYVRLARKTRVYALAMSESLHYGIAMTIYLLFTTL